MPVSSAQKLTTGGYAPQAGELVLARIRKLGQHKRLELPEGRRATLHVGDEIVVCYGNRYAPDQFEAEIPLDLSPCLLVAAGGVAAQSASKHSKISEATGIVPIGVLANEGGSPMNLADHGITPRRVTAECPPVLAVLGTSMNAGKTTTVTNLILGIRRQGLEVGAAKVTGTGAGGDVWRMTDAGCEIVLDFTDAGVPSTYKLPVARCEAIMETLIARLAEAAVDAIVIEVADGILRAETKALTASATFARLVDQVVFAATDALGAAAGVGWLAGQGLFR